MMFEFSNELEDIIKKDAVAVFAHVPPPGSDARASEVVGALVARQATLAIAGVCSPSLWNPHLGELLLRPMVEVHISLAWIMGDAPNRAASFVLDGLGKQMLANKHRSDEMKTIGRSPDDDPLLALNTEWVRSQCLEWMTDVNLGSWSGLDLRKMADEAGCGNLYRFTYPVFSAGVHSQWHHIGKYNVIPCRNPLHGGHRIPVVAGAMPADPWWAYLALKYWDKTFRLVHASNDDSVGSDGYRFACHYLEVCAGLDEFTEEGYFQAASGYEQESTLASSDLERWSSAWSSPGWGPAWKDAFEGLTAAQAAWKPEGASERVHSVWQILHHLVFWREVVVAGLDGKPPTDDEIARRNWEAPSEVSEPAWAAAKERYAASHRLMADAMARSDEAAEKLAEMLPHDAYHIGQVFTMRALAEGR